MRRVLLVTCVLSLLVPITLRAQAWSAEQQEVWSAVEYLWAVYESNDVEARLACYSDDYRGWSFGDLSPATKAQSRLFEEYYAPVQKNLITQLFPLAIDIHGDVATVFYNYRTLSLKKDGRETDEQGRWLDVYRKTNGRWLLIADYGGSVEGDDEGS